MSADMAHQRSGVHAGNGGYARSGQEVAQVAARSVVTSRLV